MDMLKGDATTDSRPHPKQPRMSLCVICKTTGTALCSHSLIGRNVLCCSSYDGCGGSECEAYVNMVVQLESTNTTTALNAHKCIVDYLRRVCLSNMARLSDRSTIEFTQRALDRLLLLRNNVAHIVSLVRNPTSIDHELLATELATPFSSCLPLAYRGNSVTAGNIEQMYAHLSYIQQDLMASGVYDRMHKERYMFRPDWSVDKSLLILDEPPPPARNVSLTSSSTESIDTDLAHYKSLITYYGTMLGRQWPMIARCANFSAMEPVIFDEITRLGQIRQSIIAMLANNITFMEHLREMATEARDRLLARNKSSAQLVNNCVLPPIGAVDRPFNITENRGDQIMATASTSSLPEIYEPPRKKRSVVEPNFGGLRVYLNATCLEELELVDSTVYKSSTCCTHKKRTTPSNSGKTRNFPGLLMYTALTSSTPIVHSDMIITADSLPGMRICWVIVDAQNTMRDLGRTKQYSLFMAYCVRVNKHQLVAGTVKSSGGIPPTRGSFQSLMSRKPGGQWHIVLIEYNAGKHMFVGDRHRGNVRLTGGVLPHYIQGHNSYEVNNGKQAIIDELKISNQSLAFLSNQATHMLMVPKAHCDLATLVPTCPTMFQTSTTTSPSPSPSHYPPGMPTITGTVVDNNFIVDLSSPSLDVAFCAVFKREPVSAGKSVFTCRGKLPDCIHTLYYISAGVDGKNLTTRMMRVVQPGVTVLN